MSKNNNSLIQKGDVVWVQYRKDPLWPALVHTVYPNNKKVTYSFFPLPKDGKKPPLFSCQPSAMYALKRTDSMPPRTHYRDDMRSAFYAAVEYMNEHKMDIGSKAPLAPHRHEMHPKLTTGHMIGILADRQFRALRMKEIEEEKRKEAALEALEGKTECEQLPSTAKAEPTTAEAEPTTATTEPTTAKAEPITAKAEAVVPLKRSGSARMESAGVNKCRFATNWPRYREKRPRLCNQKFGKGEKSEEDNQPTNLSTWKNSRPVAFRFRAQPSRNGNSDSGNVKDVTGQKEDCADIKGISKTEGGGGPRSFKNIVFENINKILNELWTDLATTGYKIPRRKEINVTLPHSKFLSDDDADCLFEQIVTFVRDREKECRLLPAVLLTSDVLFPRVIVRCIEIEKGIGHSEAKKLVEEFNGTVSSGDDTSKAPNSQISGLDALVRVACEARDKANGC